MSITEYRWLSAAVLALVAGCTAAAPPPIAKDHPAHPEATSAPLLERSTTLDIDRHTADRSEDAPAQATGHAHHGHHAIYGGGDGMKSPADDRGDKEGHHHGH